MTIKIAGTYLDILWQKHKDLVVSQRWRGLSRWYFFDLKYGILKKCLLFEKSVFPEKINASSSSVPGSWLSQQIDSLQTYICVFPACVIWG